MSIRSEIADRLDADVRLRDFPDSRDNFRCGWVRYFDPGCNGFFGVAGDAIAQNVLDVLATYEEVEVRECRTRHGTNTHWLRLPDCKRTAEDRFQIAAHSIYMKKHVRDPSVEELMQAVVDAYRSPDASLATAIEKMEAKLEKL